MRMVAIVIMRAAIGLNAGNVKQTHVPDPPQRAVLLGRTGIQARHLRCHSGAREGEPGIQQRAPTSGFRVCANRRIPEWFQITGFHCAGTTR